MKSSGYSPITADDGWFTGEDQTIQWVIYDHDPATMTDPPSVKNITGFTIQFKMATTETGASAYTKSLTLPSPTLGICQLASLAADTTGLTPTTYHYTVSRTDSGFNQVLAYGPAVLLGRPT